LATAAGHCAKNNASRACLNIESACLIRRHNAMICTHRITLVAGLHRLLVGSPPMRDLLLCAKHLFVAAMMGSRDQQWDLLSPEF
jgi:hypothetical protein